jgi:sugar phosphate permease
MRANRRTLVCHHLGFAVFSMVVYGAGAWLPTFLIRTHGWDAGQAGMAIGVLALVFGAGGTLCGGWLADRLVARGFRDGRMRVGLIAAIGTAIPSVIFPFVDSVTLALVLLAPATFFNNLAWAAAIVALQDMMPNQMRGQSAALYGAVAVIIGLGLGPTTVALITDYVFHDPAAIRWSLIIESGVCLTVAALFFYASLRPYRESLDYLKRWSMENNRHAA